MSRYHEAVTLYIIAAVTHSTTHVVSFCYSPYIYIGIYVYACHY